MKKEYTLSDNVIAEVARLLQVALLTGTDIVDNLRTIRVEKDGDVMTLHDNYIDTQTDNIERMLSEAAELSRDKEETDKIIMTNTDDDGFFN
jgi:hypothetical protein